MDTPAQSPLQRINDCTSKEKKKVSESFYFDFFFHLRGLYKGKMMVHSIEQLKDVWEEGRGGKTQQRRWGEGEGEERDGESETTLTASNCTCT